jgi:hypothetical protein
VESDVGKTSAPENKKFKKKAKGKTKANPNRLGKPQMENEGESGGSGMCPEERQPPMSDINDPLLDVPLESERKISEETLVHGDSRELRESLPERSRAEGEAAPKTVRPSTRSVNVPHTGGRKSKALKPENYRTN